MAVGLLLSTHSLAATAIPTQPAASEATSTVIEGIYLPNNAAIRENVCRHIPVGYGIPGFQPGTHRKLVRKMFGVPAIVAPGYWQNTTAWVYHLMPDRVSVGFLFDRHSHLLQQTEASFTTEQVEPRLALETLNSMLGCQLNAEITQGFYQVWQGKQQQYSFTLNSYQGIIQWESSDRVYIGIWQQGLH
ncbi:hypothetical protein [Geitlerinema sp. PCC 9228]|uniref:hypothetical protein n=1 Tax=Geitlerinema sp. PCC 9228 TaxID=111611 RepID=UPI001FCD9803|nr:hypothetical protein [Geitlerinema sp. PCC 9228]